FSVSAHGGGLLLRMTGRAPRANRPNVDLRTGFRRTGGEVRVQDAVPLVGLPPGCAQHRRTLIELLRCCDGIEESSICKTVRIEYDDRVDWPRRGEDAWQSLL